MKTLLIMRHAKADYPPDVRSDFDRPLNEQGRKDVPLVGKLLKNFGPQPDAVSASPGSRRLGDDLKSAHKCPKFPRITLSGTSSDLSTSGGNISRFCANRPTYRP